MQDLYQPGDSFLHRLAAGHKVLALVGLGTGLFLINSHAVMFAVLALVLVIYGATGLGFGRAWAQMRPALIILVLVFAVQALLGAWWLGLLIVARFAALLMVAGLLTLTTKVSDMIDAIERGLVFLRPLGVNSGKVSLAISLALRFIPVLARITEEVREAQKVRGLERSIVALAVPVITRMLKMSDDISDAIDARGYDPR